MFSRRRRVPPHPYTLNRGVYRVQPKGSKGGSRSVWSRRGRHEQKQVRRLRRDRRRLGRFAAFAEMEADLRPILLFEPPSSKAQEAAPPQVSDSGSAPEEV